MQNLFGEEEVSRDTNYDHEAGKRYCAMLGLQWDEDFARRADEMAHDNDMTQAQFDLLVREYAWKIAWLFCPRTYPWKTRVKLALHFLNPFARHIQDVAAENLQKNKET